MEMPALSGVLVGGTFAKKIVEQERPSPAVESAKTGRIRLEG